MGFLVVVFFVVVVVVEDVVGTVFVVVGTKFEVGEEPAFGTSVELDG